MLQALLVAPDGEELAIYAFALQRAGFSVLRSVDLESALERWGSAPLDLITLAHEGRSPIEQVNRLRGLTEVPIVLILDSVPETMHIALLDAGVDIVLFRPLSSRVLRAQVRALMRRATGMPLTTLPTLCVGPITLDPSTRAVEIVDRDPRRLTHLEFRLLYTLMMHEGQILSPEQLVERVWGYSGDKDRELTRSLVRRLRSKLEPDPKNPQYLVTIPGSGYVFLPKSNPL